MRYESLFKMIKCSDPDTVVSMGEKYVLIEHKNKKYDCLLISKPQDFDGNIDDHEVAGFKILLTNDLWTAQTAAIEYLYDE